MVCLSLSSAFSLPGLLNPKAASPTLHTFVRGSAYFTHMQPIEIHPFDPDYDYESAFVYGDYWLLAIRVPTIH